MYTINKTKGFTLIELMITVAIIAILASIAYPSYQDSIRKGKRNDGQAALMDLAGRQEAHYAKNATYTTERTDLNVSNRSAEGYYTIRIASANATAYDLRATPRAQGGQNQDSITQFRLRSDGRKNSRTSSGWRQGWSGY